MARVRRPRREAPALELLARTLPELRRGLTESAARTVAYELFEKLGFGAVAVTDQGRVLAFVGAGADHHAAGDVPIRPVYEALARDRPLLAPLGIRVECRHRACPLGAAAVVPLRLSDGPVGAVVVYATDGSPLRDRAVEMLAQLGDQLSAQLQLSELATATTTAMQAQMEPHLGFDDVEVIGEAAGAAEALALGGDCDAIFLDVEMPGLSGLDAARLVGEGSRTPAVVFVTAHTAYAAEAFAVEAFDYLLKPVDPDRLARVLDRIREREQPTTGAVRKIPVVAGGRIELVDDDKIHYVRADGDYSRVHTYDRAYLCTATLGALEETLPSDRFLRIHRSYLVNLAKVAAVERAGSDRLRLTLADAAGTELEVARRQAARFRGRLKLR